MATLTNLPLELQYRILSHLNFAGLYKLVYSTRRVRRWRPPILAYVRPLPILVNVRHPLLNLPLVSRHFHALVESHSMHGLKLLQARIRRTSDDTAAGDNSANATGVGATSHRGDYIQFLRSHCHLCGDGGPAANLSHSESDLEWKLVCYIWDDDDKHSCTRGSPQVQEEEGC